VGQVGGAWKGSSKVAFDDRLGAGDRPAAVLLRVVAEHLERFVGVDRVAREQAVHRSAL